MAMTNIAPQVIPGGGVTGGGAPGTGDAGGSTPDWLQLLQGGIGVGGNIASLIASLQLNNSARTNLGQSNPFGAYRGIYGNQLLSLMQDPSSVSKLPGYQFQLDQGVAALDRSALAPGGVGQGGGLDTQLLQYGQGLASSFYNNQIKTLAELAGANITPANAAQMLTASGGAQGGIGSSIGGLANSTLGLLSKLFPGGTVDPISSSDWASVYQGLNTDVGATLSSDYSNIVNDTTGATDIGGGGIDLTGLFSGPNAAGGVAANAGSTASGFSDLLSGAGAAGSGLGIISGVQQGGVKGDVTAGIDAYKLYNNPLIQALYGGGIQGVSAADWASAYADLQATTGAQLSSDAASIGLTSETATPVASEAAVGAAAGSWAAAIPPLALALFAASTPPFTLNSTYYNRFSDQLKQAVNSPMQSGATGRGAGNPALTSALDGIASNPGAVDQRTWDILSQYGITPQNIQQVYWSSQHPGVPYMYGLTPPPGGWPTSGVGGGGGGFSSGRPEQV